MMVHVLSVAGKRVSIQCQHAAHVDVLVVAERTHGLNHLVKAGALNYQLASRLKHSCPFGNHFVNLAAGEVLHNVDGVHFIGFTILKGQICDI